jgi:phospholipid/cholesterol/gamma-HCH transport system substrate-binding protein
VRPLKNETVVGVIIFCSLVLLVVSLMWLEDVRLGGRGMTLVAHFQDVTGLNRGDPVTVAGLAVGQVEDLSLAEDGVMVTFSIGEEHRLLRGSRAIIRSQGVMGEKIMAVIPGAGPEPLEPGERIPGQYEQDFTQVVSQVGTVGDELRAVLAAIRSLLSDSTSGGLRQAVRQAGAASSQLQGLLTRNASRLDETIVNLHRTSSALAQLAPGQQAEELISSLEKASRDVSATAAHMKTISASLDSLLEPSLEGRSTLGQLLSDEALYRDCRLLVNHLDSLVLDIQENPHRYFKIEIF